MLLEYAGNCIATQAGYAPFTAEEALPSNHTTTNGRPSFPYTRPSSHKREHAEDF